ncbi:DUF5348 domain-containing protein [Effusibacillus consociatus]|uniref:DUF5348 domain-containing protein n=1 Tax=Effusibacillus consociatus TaxID=1117041 RepID=A0ABV9Q7B2_9BACL
MYCTRTDRWEIHDVYANPVPLHCGESFEMKVGTVFLPCRIELDHDWVIYFFNTRFHLHPEVSYWIRVE